MSGLGVQGSGSGCADFSDAYIDTEDDVPGSNQPLPNAYTVDVTAVRKRSAYTGTPHVWPTDYYRGRVLLGDYLQASKDKSIEVNFPRGKLELMD